MHIGIYLVLFYIVVSMEKSMYIITEDLNTGYLTHSYTLNVWLVASQAYIPQDISDLEILTVLKSLKGVIFI